MRKYKLPHETKKYGFREQLGRYAVIIAIAIIFVSVIEIYVNATGVEVKEVEQGEIYPSKEGYLNEKIIRLEKDLYFEKEKNKMAVNLLNSNEVKKDNVWNGKRVLKGDLKGSEEVFLKSFSNERIGLYVMSVICAESGCGTHQCGDWNFSGIMKNGRCQSFKDLNDYIENGIKAKTGKYFNDLDKVGVSNEGLNSVFIGNGKYCTSGCDTWVGNFLYFYNKLI